MDITVACPQCQKPQTFRDLLPFRAECESCSADLHVCVSCRFYDRYVENQCREDEAEFVAVKDRRNLCEYWKSRGDGAADDEATRAKAKLDALFGGKPSAAQGLPTSPSQASPLPMSAADEAKRKLEELFKKK